ncbi:MAG: glycoside hydrolase family 18 protein [Bacillota bacterium]|nr:glycoside hydrolase family 18 protein [Bacillota bacterium]
MNKRYLLLTIILIITFTGGFFAGIFYISSTSSKNNAAIIKTRKVKMTPQPKKALKYKTKSNHHSTSEKVFTAYVQDYRNPNVVDYSKLTYVNFSFAHPTKDGGLLLNGKMASDNLHAMVAKAHQHGTKIMLAIGGWYNIQGGESYNYFKPAITDPSARTKLVNEILNMADREKLDGIDIDFEHPRSNDDALNLTAFMKDLNDKLHREHKELSIAVHSKINSNTGTEANYVVYDPTMFQYVDHVNIMAYDGQYDGGYHAANLSPYPFTEEIVNYWSKLFDQNNVSKQKLVLGVPSYAQPENPAIKQVSYSAILKNNPANAQTDSVNMNGTTYYYNGLQTIQKKTKLALDHGFGGMMLWESGLDASGPQSITSTVSAVLKSSEKGEKQQIAQVQ